MVFRSLKHNIWDNFVSLSVLQMANYILPLIALPYLIRTLGMEAFGLWIFATTICAYFIIITDYGFSISATREISIHRNDMEKVGEIFSAVLTVKILLAVGGLIVLAPMVYLMPKLQMNPEAYFAAYTVVLAQAIFPTWLFQGLEKMREFAIYSVCSKAFATLALFFVVTKPQDYYLASILTAIGTTVAAIIAIYRLDIRFVGPSLKTVKYYIKDGWRSFNSNFLISIYTNSPTILLGFFSTAGALGAFAVAERVTQAIRSLAGMFFNASYSHVCRMQNDSRQELALLYKKFWLAPVMIFGLSLLVFAGSDMIVWLASGHADEQASLALKILSFIPFVVVLNIPAYQSLLSGKKESSANIVFAAAATLCVILGIIFSTFFAAIGMSVVFLLVEIGVTIGLYVLMQLKHPQLSLFKQSTEN